METVLLIAQIIIYTWLLIALLRQSYNILFILSRKPGAWISFTAFLGVVNILLASGLGWNSRLVATAVLTAVIILLPSVPKGMSKDNVASMADSVYEELGIKKGRLKYRLGIAAFGGTSLILYVLVFGELCTSDGTCAAIYRSLL